MEEDRKILRSYNKLKNFEIKIYRLGNTKIPFPVPITTTVYFVVALIIIAIIDATIGIHINFIYKYVALPLGIAYIDSFGNSIKQGFNLTVVQEGDKFLVKTLEPRTSNIDLNNKINN